MTILIALQLINIGFVLGMFFIMALDLHRDKKKRKYDKLVADVAHKVKHG